jgi:hypothetical protein
MTTRRRKRKRCENPDDDARANNSKPRPKTIFQILRGRAPQRHVFSGSARTAFSYGLSLLLPDRVSRVEPHCAICGHPGGK